MEYVGFAASFVMGIILGLMGGGGGILTVPIFVYLFAVSPLVATGYSLFVVGSTALLGSFMALRKGDVDWQTGLALALPNVLGVFVARGLIVPQLPAVVVEVGGFVLTKDVFVMIVFAILMVAASVSMLRTKKSRKPMDVRPFVRMVLIAGLGLGVGLIAGFVGAGGGFLLIPALVLVLGLSMRIAVGTSLMVIAIQSLLGFTGDVLRGLPMDWALLGAVAVFALLGIVVGFGFAHKVKEQRLKSAFGWFILVMGVTILFEQSRHLFQ